MTHHVVPFPQVSQRLLPQTSERLVNIDPVTATPVDRISVMARRLNEHDPALLIGIQTVLEELLHALKLDLPSMPTVPACTVEPEMTIDRGSSRLVTLTSGATLMLSVSEDVLRLSPTDRQMVLSLIEQFEAYEQTRAEAQ